MNYACRNSLAQRERCLCRSVGLCGLCSVGVAGSRALARAQTGPVLSAVRCASSETRILINFFISAALLLGRSLKNLKCQKPKYPKKMKKDPQKLTIKLAQATHEVCRRHIYSRDEPKLHAAVHVLSTAYNTDHGTDATGPPARCAREAGGT